MSSKSNEVIVGFTQKPQQTDDKPLVGGFGIVHFHFTESVVVKIETPLGNVKIGYVPGLGIQIVDVYEDNGKDVTNFRRNGTQVVVN
jgi:hypothetical protein